MTRQMTRAGGNVRKNELQILMTMREKVEFIFKLFDFGGEGSICYDEMVVLTRACGKGVLKALEVLERRKATEATLAAGGARVGKKGSGGAAVSADQAHGGSGAGSSGDSGSGTFPYTQQQLTALHNAMDNEMEKVSDEAFLEADDDQSGLIDVEEFVDFVLNDLKRIAGEYNIHFGAVGTNPGRKPSMAKGGSSASQRQFDLKFCFEYFGVPLETEEEERAREEEEQAATAAANQAKAREEESGDGGGRRRSAMEQKTFDYKQEAIKARERTKKQREERRQKKQKQEDEEEQAEAVRMQQQMLHDQLSRRLQAEAAVGLSKYREYAREVEASVARRAQKRTSLVMLQQKLVDELQAEHSGEAAEHHEMTKAQHSVPIKDLPEYQPYLKMLNTGLPKKSIARKMRVKVRRLQV
jgi:hypothetical protein